MTAPSCPRVGRPVTRLDPADWSLHTFVTHPLVRPIDLRFNSTRESLYILDFGYFEMDSEHGVVAEAKSGKLWRIKLTA